jgi:ornithine--oxo-acid transaminase
MTMLDQAGAQLQALSGRAMRPELLTVEDAHKLDVATVADLFRRHVSPGQLRLMELLGFHTVLVKRAEGVHYIDRDGRPILDFFGGFGSLAFGHNHPRIVNTRMRFQQEQRHEIALAFMSQYATALAKNLATIAPADLDVVFLCCTGSEAVEAALKLAEQHQGRRRATVAYAQNSFHGKTRGALSVTDGRRFRSGFKLLPNCVAVPFGDAAALEKLLRRRRDVGALILETVQGAAGVVLPPAGYFRAVRELCDRYSVLWIADEIQSGVGRTGRFFAFEHFDVAPDIITLAKSLGAGKAAVAAVISRSSVHARAYGSARTALIHGPATFSGMGEACCTAVEALNVLYDERLMENAARQGLCLLSRLEWLRSRYPRIIKQVRGLGLMVAIEFADISQLLPASVGKVLSILDGPLRGGLCVLVGSLLLAEFGILVAFTEYNRNVIRLEPPLLVDAAHVDTLIDALDSLLARGLTGMVVDYLRLVWAPGGLLPQHTELPTRLYPRSPESTSR